MSDQGCAFQSVEGMFLGEMQWGSVPVPVLVVVVVVGLGSVPALVLLQGWTLYPLMMDCREKEGEEKR